MFKKFLTITLCVVIAISVAGCKTQEEEPAPPPETPITYTYTTGEIEVFENYIADSFLGVDARGLKIKFLKENAVFTFDQTFTLEKDKDNYLYSFVACPLLSSFNAMESDIGQMTFKFTDVKSGEYLIVEHEGDKKWWAEGPDDKVFECSRIGVAGPGQKIAGTSRNSTANLSMGIYHPLNSPFTGSKYSTIDVIYNPKKNVLSAEPVGYYFSSIVRDFSFAYPEDPVTWDGFNDDAEIKLTITFNRFAHKDERDNLEASIILISTFGNEFYKES